VRTLPKVYNPKSTPWNIVDTASTEELINQFSQIPSGALSYYTNIYNKQIRHE